MTESARKLDDLSRELQAAPVRERAAGVWRCMHELAREGESVPVEKYLEAAGLSVIDPQHESACVDILYADYLLSPQSDERMRDYQSRFPSLMSGFRQQLQFDSLVGAGESIAAGETVISPLGARSQSAPDGDSIPTAIGRYRIVGRLGKGGQADVWRGVHPTLGRDIVLKVARSRWEGDDRSKSAMLQEGRILASLQHPHLAQIYDLEFQGDRPFLVLEYISGRSLDQVQKSAALPPREAAGLAAKLARALAAVSQRGILHLDVKPANVVLDERGEPRLLDFGLGRWRSLWGESPAVAGSVAGSVAGTPAYMAPEQARGEVDRLGPATDVFGVGALLYELLTGRPPYERPTILQAIEAARQADFDRRALDDESIPDEIRRICLRAMEPRPEDRFRMSELAEALEAASQREGWSRRAALAVAVATSLAAVGVWQARGLWSRRREAGAARERTPIVPIPLSIRVFRNDRFVDVIDASPLETGDELAIRAVIPDRMEATLFSVNSEGLVQSLGRVEGSAPSRELRFPPGRDQVSALEGPAGGELLVVCVSSSGRPGDPVSGWEEFRSKWRSLAFRSVFSLSPEAVRVESAGRDFGPSRAERDVEGEARQVLEELRQRLMSSTEGFTGMAFPHQGVAASDEAESSP